MNKLKYLLSVGFLVLLNFSSLAIPVTQIRENLLFNNGWKFIANDNPKFRNPDFNDISWRSLNLPHDWSIEGIANKSNGGANGYFPVGVVWYRKTFELPGSMKEKQVIIQFDGIYMNSEVWINGILLGRYPYGYTTFQYDITEYLKKGIGDKNIVAVRVDNSLKESTRWYNGTGIYRNVWLTATNYLHFNNYKGVFVTTNKATIEKGEIKIDYDITSNFFNNKEFEYWRENPYKDLKYSKKSVIIRSTIIDKEGNQIARSESIQEISNYEKNYLLSQIIDINKPKLWSSNSPIIYYLKSEILCDGKIIDDKVTSFGIRKLDYIAGKGLFINGEIQKLKGVCLHQDAGSFGVAVPIEIWHYRLMKLKEMGCNAIRTAHNPFAPEFYDLCDSLGFYVMNEAFDEWTRGWPYNFTDNNKGKAQNGYHLYFNQWAETDIKAMLWRDRNHPSIIMYSIGNEIPDQKSSNGFELAHKLVAICHKEDNTRPVTAACDQYLEASKNGFIDELDISGYNYIDRHYEKEMYGPEHQKRLNKLCLGTETNKNVNNFLAFRDSDYVIGSFIWVGIDYFGETNKYPQRGWTKALIDIAGFEKPEYFLYKSYWSDKPTVHIGVSKKDMLQSMWNWNDKDSLNVYVYSNCDEVELFLNNKSLGKKVVNKNLYYSVWPVIYTKGILKAIGYNADKKVEEHVIETSYAVKSLLARSNKISLVANGKDVALLEITAVDNNNIPVFNANDEITVNVTGQGNLIGIDNGDINYAGLFKTNKRKLYQGKLLIAIQSTELPGMINIQISSSKLKAFQLKYSSMRK